MTNQILLLVLFLVIVYAIYLCLPKKARPYLLLVASLIFYAVYSKFLTVFLILTIISTYLGGFGINKLNDKFNTLKEGLEKEEKKALRKKFSRKKYWLSFAIIIFNLAILAVLKYFNFFTSVFEGFLSWFNVSAKMPILKLALPLGISYYTLSAIGYVVDVNRGKYRAGSFFDVALFLAYFPQLFEGPFARFDELTPDLKAGNGFNSENFYGGIITILWGVVKKVVIADRLAIIVSAVFKNYASYNGLVIILGIVLFTFQLYAEFSGMIDIASGISEVFGIKLAKNFNQPFFSQNVNEFWRRWHISLGTWFKDYIFYPVSMSKGMVALNKKMQGKVSQYFQTLITGAVALLCVWLSNGLWHGAGFKYIVYGLYYYVLMVIGLCLEPLYDKFYSKTKIDRNSSILKALRIAKTFIFVNIGMLIFRATSLSVSLEMFGGIFTGGKINLCALGVIDYHDLAFCVIGLILLFVVDILKEKNIDIKGWFVKRNIAIKYLIVLSIIVFIIVFGAYGDGYVPVDPIYGGF